jgi:hypothetical protein
MVKNGILQVAITLIAMDLIARCQPSYLDLFKTGMMI